MEDNSTIGWLRAKPAAKLLGICQARVYSLVKNNPAIKTCKLIDPGTQRGALLIEVASLVAYLNTLAEAQRHE